MKNKMTIAVAAVFVAALTVCACGKKEENTTFTGDTNEEPAYQANLNAISPSAYSNVQGLKLEPGTYISIIGKDSSSAYWKTVEEGVAQAAADLNEALGYTGSDKIKVTYNAPSKTEDIDEQVNILDEELARYPDVVGIASIDADACSVQFDLATENGIPVISLDSGNVYQGIQCSVSTDNEDAARTGAYKLADEIGGEGELLLLVHDSESETAQVREQSFVNEIEENHPDVQVVEKIYCDKLEDYKKQIAEEKNADIPEEEQEITVDDFSDEDVILYYLEKHSDIKGVFGTNNTATQLALSALEEVEKERTEEHTDEAGDDSEQKDADADESGDNAASENEAATNSGEAATADTGSEAVDKTASENGEAGTAADKTASENGEVEDTDDGSGTDGDGEESGNAEEEAKKIILMGFDAGKDQLSALEEGKISGLVVQNPFGIGYASVVAAARTVLQVGNEAQVNTGYIWVTKDNMEEESIQKMLYQ